MTTTPTPVPQITEKQIRQRQQARNYHEDQYEPATEVESDRQQRVYRGQPSTIGQVQSDRDGLRRNVISVSAARSPLLEGRQKLIAQLTCHAGEGEGEPGEHACTDGNPLQVRKIDFEKRPAACRDLFTRFLFRRRLPQFPRRLIPAYATVHLTSLSGF